MWIDLNKERKLLSIEKVSASTGLPNFAIEKDWWVCLVLKAVFQSKYAEFIIFKGGTSLSKAYSLIERFSEDVDLIIDRKLLGYEEVKSKTQIKKLRKISGGFIINEFKEELIKQLNGLGVEGKFCIQHKTYVDDTSDPNSLEIYYDSIFNFSNDYIKPRVLLEMSARSMTEPSEQKEIISWIDEEFKNTDFAENSFNVEVVMPQRTFLEKIFLLHEEFRKPKDRIRTYRMTRHLYDVEKIANTEYGNIALNNNILFNAIVEHRKHFTPLKGEDYSKHLKGFLNILPPQDLIKKWKEDYKSMQENMISGESLQWEELLDNIKKIQNNINI
ncbi:MAG: nucleotidyl transferase AbiEii/AbiGii toxin family protein [Tenacibaculum sp.]|nr:nucleotidyl transferase AbiEii/AbiGii toxin family protein [Tenacibaculum sp.]